MNKFLLASIPLFLVACGSAPPSAHTKNPAPSHAASPSATPSPTATPAPSEPTLNPIQGTPGFTDQVPSAWSIVEQDTQQVKLSSTSGAEQIRLLQDLAIEQTKGLPTTTVAGHAAYIVSDGVGNGGLTYTRVWLIQDNKTLYELLCTGYEGYDKTTLLAGCNSFTASLHFTG